MLHLHSNEAHSSSLGFCLVAGSMGLLSSCHAWGFLLRWLLLLQSSGSRCVGSVAVSLGLCCSAACGILPDQGWNPGLLHQQVDSLPLRHQGSAKFLCWWLLLLLLEDVATAHEEDRMLIPDGEAGCPHLFTVLYALRCTTVRVQSENNGTSGNTTCHHCS